MNSNLHIQPLDFGLGLFCLEMGFMFVISVQNVFVCSKIIFYFFFFFFFLVQSDTAMSFGSKFCEI